MRPDRLHDAVRPRGILECLDLAVLFCGRRPLAVLAAAAVGAAPCIGAGRLVFADAAGADLLLAACWFLGLAAPWAAAPLVLYLGQAVFADRFSWAIAARSFRGGLPAMILFQVLLRGMCLGVVVLAPVVVVGMYFLDPIILLERPGLTRVWSRRTAINRRGLGRIVSLAVVDAAILATGWFLGVVFIDALAALWHGAGAARPDETTGPVAALFSWSSQLALWSTNAFLVVYRFFGYLDARIRHEGWDVELKFRSDATYAGLARRHRAAAAAVVAGLALFATATTAPGAERPTDAAAAARSALERQRFPWYDAAADDYRPLVDASPAPRQQPARSPAPIADAPGGAGLDLDVVLQLALLFAAVTAAAWLLVRYGLPDLAAPDAERPAAVADVLGAEQLEALPAAARALDGDLLAEASARADRGDHAGAMIFFHAWLLVQLHARGVLALARGKTNGRYVAEVAAAEPRFAPTFARSTRLFEDAFFGRLPVAAEDFQAVWDRRVDVEPSRD